VCVCVHVRICTFWCSGAFVRKSTRTRTHVLMNECVSASVRACVGECVIVHVCLCIHTHVTLRYRRVIFEVCAGSQALADFFLKLALLYFMCCSALQCAAVCCSVL